jgi:elongation factor 1-gamma
VTEIDAPLHTWLGPIKGNIPNDSEATKKAIADVRKVLQTLDTHLASRTFLVRERVTLADIVVSLSLLPAYQLVFDPGFRKAFKHANRSLF